MVLLDYKDRRPLYEQIVDRVEELILRNVWEADSQLPSVRSLAAELSINPNTIQRAYMELERRGYIYSIKGKGSFISDVRNLRSIKRKEWDDRLKQVVRDGKELGISREELMQEVDDFYVRGGENHD
ncbi:MAG: GntR family transcriptional regulator [Lachnospiraceae bacterium]